MKLPSTGSRSSRRAKPGMTERMSIRLEARMGTFSNEKERRDCEHVPSTSMTDSAAKGYWIMLLTYFRAKERRHGKEILDK